MNTLEPTASPSLRRRLLGLVLAAIGAVTLLQATTTYRTALLEADKMFDYHLQEVARSVHGGVPFVPGNDDSEYSVQVWGPDGTTIYRSNGVRLPAQAVLGFSDTKVNGIRLRIYSLQTPEHTIQIAQDLDAREARARALAANAVLPALVLAPLLMLAVGWVISASLAPLTRMRRQVAARESTDLSPLAAEGVPQEVQPLVRELNALFGRVRETMEAQQHFVADAAHELRSPLTALKLQVQAAERARDEETRRAATAALAGGIERAIALVEQLLVLAREEGAMAALPAEDVDLEALARESVSELLPKAQARQQDLGLADSEPLSVRAVPDALRLLLRNLVDNAIKYTPAGGRIDIAMGRAEGAAWLAVEDSGPGIPEAERQRVFDRFYRVPGSEAPGSGLGLAIVKAIAERMGAQLSLGPSALGGLRAEIRFPAGA
ncbi:two-component sensor histidine kinase [Ramlibacter sp. G-1-2-2]|uniref:histidine kinase n=1 Tax=Ramlibacter agri TaxID=2728837 RepID=A0A848H2Z8_9BURK|nr:ATP-binding protein [Ramlibacter agri]NML44082.1 two-component sensor histidine kinase [Ramlibacter agri]